MQGGHRHRCVWCVRAQGHICAVGCLVCLLFLLPPGPCPCFPRPFPHHPPARPRHPQIFPWLFKKATYINLAAMLGLWHLPLYTGRPAMNDTSYYGAHVRGRGGGKDR